MVAHEGPATCWKADMPHGDELHLSVPSLSSRAHWTNAQSATLIGCE